MVRAGSIDELLDVFSAISRENAGGRFNRDRMRAHFSECDGFLVAECNDKLVGAISFSTTGMRGKVGPILDSAAVRREYLRRGIGTQLCVRAIAELASKGHLPIYCAPISALGYALASNLPQSLRHLQIEYNPNPIIDRLQGRALGKLGVVASR
jgi:GNAT superfamily N-acetyltransferase